MNFVALDGEGITREDNSHDYIMLYASDGTGIENVNGLSCRDCLTYLLNLHSRHPKGSVFVGFYFSYDVNMIIQHGLDVFAKFAIARYGYCKIWDKDGTGWKLDYQPKKMFIIRRIRRHGRSYKISQSMTIYDVWGFFQKSFVGALDEFSIGDDATRNRIRMMKDQRSTFSTAELASIRSYNIEECILLKALMELLADRLESIGLRLTQWHGAGAIANALLRREKAKQHLWAPTDPLVDHAVMCAYYGGRVQALKLGSYDNVHSYDLVSAYPSAMAQLPSLKGCIVIPCAEFQPDKPLSIYRVRWNVEAEHSVTPFPFRQPDGSIEFPSRGEGWFWHPEVDIALERFPGQIEILDGYIFEPANPASRPYQFIERMFEHRRILKQNGDFAQVCIKLGLNSLYGKTAQGLGYGKTLPAFQCYIVAGWITSHTRAKLVDAAMQSPESIVSFATDGILATEPLNLPVAAKLGSWERDSYDKMFMLKPGIYTLTSGSTTKLKVRGYAPKSLDFDEIERVWAERGVLGTYTLSETRFIGIKSASKNRPHCQWIESPKTMTFMPTRGVPLATENRRYDIQPVSFCHGVSAAYKRPKQTAIDECPESEYCEYMA